MARKPHPFSDPYDYKINRTKVTLDWDVIVSLDEKIRFRIEMHLRDFFMSINGERGYPEDFKKLATALETANSKLETLPKGLRSYIQPEDIDGFQRMVAQVNALSKNKVISTENRKNKNAGEWVPDAQERPREHDYWAVCVRKIAVELKRGGIPITQTDLSSPENLAGMSAFQLVIFEILQAAGVDDHMMTRGAWTKAVIRALKDK